jgi:hypothetical protein
MARHPAGLWEEDLRLGQIREHRSGYELEEQFLILVHRVLRQLRWMSLFQSALSVIRFFSRD